MATDSLLAHVLRVLFWLLQVVAWFATATPSVQQLSPLPLHIAGPGASAKDPAYGEVVTLVVGECGGRRNALGAASDCPPWIRVERADVGSLHGPAHANPVFWPTAAGNLVWKFGGKSDNAPVPIVASGWTSKYNGTRLTANSSIVLAHYVVTRQMVPTRLEVAPLGPGSARITVVAANSSEPLIFSSACPCFLLHR